MATLLLQLVGPMQSWGTTSRFNERDTGNEPSKSGVIGLLAAALGNTREDWSGGDVERLAQLAMGVRYDRPGVPRRDYQTAGCATNDTIIKADGAQAKDGGVVSQRFYLADAAFLVGLEGTNRPLLEKVYAALRDPVWPLSLGRKSYVPSESVWIKEGMQDCTLRAALTSWPWIGGRPDEESPKQLLLSMDSSDGSGALRMDQPLSSFAERRFGARCVQSEWIACPKEASHVPA